MYPTGERDTLSNDSKPAMHQHPQWALGPKQPANGCNEAFALI